MTAQPHLVDATGAPLCPEADYRDSLDDGAFWDHVFNGPRPVADDYDPDDDPNADDQAEAEFEARVATPCPECGQRGACAYDAEGRPLIHATTDDTEDGR